MPENGEVAFIPIKMNFRKNSHKNLVIFKDMVYNKKVSGEIPAEIPVFSVNLNTKEQFS